MPLKFLFANNVRSRLVAPLNTTDTTFTITAGDGDKFPSPDGSKLERVALTLVDTLGNMEIVYVTKRVADVFTVVRAQEGTTAKTFAEGDIVDLRITAASLNQINEVEIPPSLVAKAICTTAANVQIKRLTVNNFDVNTGQVLYVEFYMGNINPTMYLTVNGSFLPVINPEDTITGAITDPPYPVIIFVHEYDGWRAYNPIAGGSIYPVTYGTTLSEKKLLIAEIPKVVNGKITLSSIDGITLSKANSSSPFIFKVDGQVTAQQFNGILNGTITPAVAIDGVNFSGAASVTHFAVCDTAADVAAKVVSVPNITNNTDGTVLYVRFTNGNTAPTSDLTLDVGFGPNPIKFKTGNILNTWIANRELVLHLINYLDTWWAVGHPDFFTLSQYVSNTSDQRFPILTTRHANLSTSTTGHANFTASVTITPSTNTITAGTFAGNLAGTATNATQWGGSNKYLSSGAPSGGVHGDIWFQYI